MSALRLHLPAPESRPWWQPRPAKTKSRFGLYRAIKTGVGQRRGFSLPGRKSRQMATSWPREMRLNARHIICRRPCLGYIGVGSQVGWQKAHKMLDSAVYGYRHFVRGVLEEGALVLNGRCFVIQQRASTSR